MKFYRVHVAVPFDDSMTDEECRSRMHNWLNADDGTIVSIRPISQDQFNKRK